MKKISYAISFLLFAMLLTSNLFAQDMKKGAGELYNAGNKALKAGQYADAIAKYDSAIQIQKDYRIFYQKGLAMKRQGKYDSALVAFQNCANAKSDFAAAYNAMGGVYYALGKYEDAVKNFEKVVSIVKNDQVKKEVQSNLAFALTKLGANADQAGDPKKAVGYLEKAVSNANYDAAYLALAKAYTELGENDKAIDAGEKALKYGKTVGKGGPYYYIGLAYKNKGEVDKAKQMFEKAKSDATYKKSAEYELSVLK